MLHVTLHVCQWTLRTHLVGHEFVLRFWTLLPCWVGLFCIYVLWEMSMRPVRYNCDVISSYGILSFHTLWTYDSHSTNIIIFLFIFSVAIWLLALANMCFAFGNISILWDLFFGGERGGHQNTTSGHRGGRQL